MIKKELGVYRRVPGSSDQKTDLFAFGEHPSDTVKTCGYLIKLCLFQIIRMQTNNLFNKIGLFYDVTYFMWHMIRWVVSHDKRCQKNNMRNFVNYRVTGCTTVLLTKSLNNA